MENMRFLSVPELHSMIVSLATRVSILEAYVINSSAGPRHTLGPWADGNGHTPTPWTYNNGFSATQPQPTYSWSKRSEDNKTATSSADVPKEHHTTTSTAVKVVDPSSIKQCRCCNRKFVHKTHTLCNKCARTKAKLAKQIKKKLLSLSSSTDDAKVVASAASNEASSDPFASDSALTVVSRVVEEGSDAAAPATTSMVPIKLIVTGGAYQRKKQKRMVKRRVPVASLTGTTGVPSSGVGLTVSAGVVAPTGRLRRPKRLKSSPTSSTPRTKSTEQALELPSNTPAVNSATQEVSSLHGLNFLDDDEQQ